jgi:hypothetical protein
MVLEQHRAQIDLIASEHEVGIWLLGAFLELLSFRKPKVRSSS